MAPLRQRAAVPSALPALSAVATLLARARAEGPMCCDTAAHVTLFKGPAGSGKDPEGWRRDLLDWRAKTASADDYTGQVYEEEPVLNWTRTSYVQPQVHLWDKYLYDVKTHKFTVQRYLDDLKARYGGIDSVLLWPTYPNIGIDSRNQWDLWRALPGGLDQIKDITRQFHEAGVKVLWAYNPFDQGLADEGEPHWTTLARLLKETGGDGFNGDTMDTIYKEFMIAAKEINYPIVGEAEGGGYLHKLGRPADDSWAPLNWEPLGWGYYHYGAAPDGITNVFWDEPGIDRAKWLDASGRRQTHVCDRWAKDRHSAMQFAHFNGVGYESWENVWGISMHFTERDGEALRRAQTVWRWLGESEYTQGYQDWHPFTPEVEGETGIYASRWKHKDGSCAWTVVNRNESVRPFTLNVDEQACAPGRLYDLFSGLDVPEHFRRIEGLGYGAFVRVPQNQTAHGLQKLLAKMKAMTVKPLSSFDASWSPMQQTLQAQDSPAPVQEAPKGMVQVPRTTYRFQTGGVEIEGGCDPDKDTAGTGNCCTTGVVCPSGDERCFDMCGFSSADERGVDVQFPWETTPRRFHDAELDVGPFYIDKHPVTNEEFSEWVKATDYVPRNSYNFVKHWQNATHPKFSDSHKPVVWVSVDEARAFCKSAGKRLPHVWEWQLAAQGSDGRTYPWGNERLAGMFPTPGHGREVPELPDVGSFEQGVSPHGMSDAVGLVWQMTDVFEDERTRAIVLKGSSLYNPVLGGDFPALPQVGNWYFPPARKLTQHNRLLLMDESYDRAGTMGFRCVADHPEGGQGPLHLHSAAETQGDGAQGFLQGRSLRGVAADPVHF